jgi:hypothetical protein
VTRQVDEIRDDIVEQVRQLEELRESGTITHAWYLRTRASIVKRHREQRAARPASRAAEAFRSTLELPHPA